MADLHVGGQQVSKGGRRRGIGWLIVIILVVGFIGMLSSFDSSTSPRRADSSSNRAAPQSQRRTARNWTHQYIAKDVVNLRARPSTEAAVVRKLKLGSLVWLSGEKSGGWNRVRFENDTGWVYSYLMTKSDPRAERAAAQTQTAPSPIAGLYEIIREETLLDIKSSLDIRLKRKVDKATIRRIAHALRSDGRQKYDRVFICYYLPGMTVGNVAWATSHLNPNLEIEMLGHIAERYNPPK